MVGELGWVPHTPASRPPHAPRCHADVVRAQPNEEHAMHSANARVHKAPHRQKGKADKKAALLKAMHNEMFGTPLHHLRQQ